MNKLKQIRSLVNLSLRDLEKYTNIDQAIINYLERGIRQFRQIHIETLCTFFNVSADYLLGKSNSGIVVFPEKGDEVVLNEVDFYELLHQGKIKTTIIKCREPNINISVGIPRYLPEYSVYRELKGSVEDYDLTASLVSEITDLCKVLNINDLKKIKSFIQDYIIK